MSLNYAVCFAFCFAKKSCRICLSSFLLISASLSSCAFFSFKASSYLCLASSASLLCFSARSWNKRFSSLSFCFLSFSYYFYISAWCLTVGYPLPPNSVCLITFFTCWFLYNLLFSFSCLSSCSSRSLCSLSCFASLWTWPGALFNRGGMYVRPLSTAWSISSKTSATSW